MAHSELSLKLLNPNFRPSNCTVRLHNIDGWLYFPSLCSQWKIFPKLYSRQLLFSALDAKVMIVLILERSDGSIFYLFSNTAVDIAFKHSQTASKLDKHFVFCIICVSITLWEDSKLLKWNRNNTNNEKFVQVIYLFMWRMPYPAVDNNELW